MFRVKIDIRALTHDAKLKPRNEAEACAPDRLGDWADELRKPQSKLTREDLCRTFQDKFRDCGHSDGKTVA